jgi:hypothetical protein
MACTARLTAEHTGHTRLLDPGRSVDFGRDPSMEFSFPGDPRLSRRAGRITHRDEGVSVANLSSTHSLYVRTGSGRTRLPPHTRPAPPAAVVLGGGVHHVEAPSWEDNGCRITVEVSSPEVQSRAPGTAHGTRTVLPVRLNPATKEFAIALVLCRAKLIDGPAAPVPSAAELVRQVLELTSSYSLLREFESDQPVAGGRSTRARLLSRIHEHMRQLRTKLQAAGFASPGELLAPSLADALIENDVVTVAHLKLLEEPSWLETQEQLWWPDD